MMNGWMVGYLGGLEMGWDGRRNSGDLRV